MFIDLSQEYPTAAYEIRSIFESRVDRERSASSGTEGSANKTPDVQNEYAYDG